MLLIFGLAGVRVHTERTLRFFLRGFKKIFDEHWVMEKCYGEPSYDAVSSVIVRVDAEPPPLGGVSTHPTSAIRCSDSVALEGLMADGRLDLSVVCRAVARLAMYHLIISAAIVLYFDTQHLFGYRVLRKCMTLLWELIFGDLLVSALIVSSSHICRK